MYLVYTFLLYTALLLTLPWYALKFRKYAPTLKDRLGFLKIPTLQRTVWVHAVSVGEVKSVRKLIERLRLSHSGRPLVLTTTTPTGQELAQNTEGLADYVFFFPLDLPGSIRRTLDRVNPELVLIAETEIWPNFLRECRKRRIPVVMVNGRISDRSFPRYRVVRRWLKRVLDDFTLLGMQTETDRERIESIGADTRKVTVLGNLKYDALEIEKALAPDLSDILTSRPDLWIAASTMPGEEELVLEAFSELRKRHANLTLLIAPRHPERFDGVERTIRSSGFTCARRSVMGQAEERSPTAGGADVLLLDTVGELASTFRHASVVFVGGSLVPTGGHNILEPAAFGNPIVFGPHMENFREIRNLFLESRAAMEVHDAVELAAEVDRLLTDPQSAAELGSRARRVVDENAGATDRVLEHLR
jgi:3-deoxy-D-manno-octulosonic-acid transferase